MRKDDPVRSARFNFKLLEEEVDASRVVILPPAAPKPAPSAPPADSATSPSSTTP
ncbi:MAG: hypothetical protein ACYC9N_13490 [Thermoanaerobaculia bacterium]